MKIAVTGANEFVGAFICRYFHAAGHQILAVDSPQTPHQALSKIADYIQADILKPLPAFDADICIHAASYHNNPVNYQDLFMNHVEGTLNVIEAAHSCSRIIHISSSSVYQFGKEPMKESDATLKADLSEYGETKLLAEEVVCFEIPFFQKRLILRPRAIYGIGDATFLPRLFDLQKGPIIYCGVHRDVKTSLTHIENLAYAIDLFLHQEDGPPLQIYNVADEPVYSVCDSITDVLSAIEDQPLELVNVPETVPNSIDMINSGINFVRPANVNSLKPMHHNSVLDLYCIRKHLNYEPRKDLQNSMFEIAEVIKSIGGKKLYIQQLASLPWMPAI
ncbi:NAD(P)-dependent oxidoreductase [Flavihumibacter sp. R14]|nr:NAD(P)-dependent oxidoreductase [Flavihumibacter soli]